MKEKLPREAGNQQQLNQQQQTVKKLAETLKEQTSSHLKAKPRTERHITRRNLQGPRSTSSGRYGLDLLL